MSEKRQRDFVIHLWATVRFQRCPPLLPQALTANVAEDRDVGG